MITKEIVIDVARMEFSLFSIPTFFRRELCREAAEQFVWPKVAAAAAVANESDEAFWKTVRVEATLANNRLEELEEDVQLEAQNRVRAFIRNGIVPSSSV